MSYFYKFRQLGFLLLMVSQILRGAEYRVSSVPQITSALSTVKPGDTLTMTNGTWTDVFIQFAATGTASAPILLRAESYGGVVITGASNLRISGKHLIADGLLFRNGSSGSGDVIEFRGTNGESDSCRLTNCSVINFNPADSTRDYKWVSLYGRHNRVDHCYLKGKKHSGTTLVVWLSVKPNYHQIDHNYFANRPELYGWNGGETIRVGTSDWSQYDSFTTVEYNLFEECNGEIEIISNKSCGNMYRHNTFIGCQGTLTLRHGNRATVEGNFFDGRHAVNSGGIRIIGEDHKVFNNYIAHTDGSSLKSALTIMNGVPNSPLDRYFQVKRAVVVFNTFVDTRYTFNIGGGKDAELSLAPDSCVIANNVVYTTTAPIITYSDIPTHHTWQGNMMYGASLGIAQPSGIMIVNPQLALSSDGLWRPANSSPVLNAAQGVYPFITTDMDGQVRDALPDVGADEVAPAPMLFRPLTPADVGPPSAMIVTHALESGAGMETVRKFSLAQNYPNPFNPATMINYELSVPGHVTLTVYDVLGREAAVLANETEPAGLHSVRWNAAGCASGFYFAQLETGGQVQVQKLVLTK
jgi:poly(beta-D-mannuronate) lyase